MTNKKKIENGDKSKEDLDMEFLTETIEQLVCILRKTEANMENYRRN